MSSAALQTAQLQQTLSPHPQTATAGSASGSPSSHRQYTHTNSPSREAYYATRDTTNPSPASSKRSSRKATDNQDRIPASPMTSRTTLASPVTAAPASTSDYERTNPNRRRHEVPPRTSSTQQGSTGASTSARRAARAEERDRPTDSPRQSDQARPNTTTSTNGRSEPNRSYYDDPSSRSRRAVSHHIASEPADKSSSNKEYRQTVSTTIPVRTHTNSSNATANSKQPSREASEVLNRVIVSRPEEDLERERERLEEAHPHSAADDADATPPSIPLNDAPDDARRGGRSRHDHSRREKGSKFGDYYLGNTIGEGEFGKVKLGWKQDGGVQVAIKLIRRDSVGNNPSRLAKIYREVSILRGISHPNIVKLHEMTETERHIGIVLEYASGGELFDYILNHRYLKDNAAKRLFAQLVSGVGYLHKKGIVHRDLKLENLLLDRNRNIIITDFGFANTFDPNDELSEQEEIHLSDRELVKRLGLDKTKANGMRRGDLMQTSCGSPCYAAPELVVSDSLYTGRKVDVWSCGVILYAMLAGYLPFDDDPANPEGDNINLLYKYIVNTPLTFPEYVTPHARDLLRRILVPSPRKRADLFEVARHSWLSEYAHVVELITSTTTTSTDIQNTTVPADDMDAGGLARSASVREPTKAKNTAAPAVGDLARKQGKVDPEESSQTKTPKDSKRRTVQVEYVAPTTQTQRGEPSDQASPHGKSRARPSSQEPVNAQASQEKITSRDGPLHRDGYSDPLSQRKPPSAHRNQNMAATRTTSSRATSDNTNVAAGSGINAPRPATGGSMQSMTGSKAVGPNTRASYGQPLPPTVVDTNAIGSIQQPKTGAKNYVISNPIPQETQDADYGRPSVTVPSKFAQVSGFTEGQDQESEAKGHKRSNTIGEIGGKIFGRSGSLFGGRKKRVDQQQSKEARKYPPVSMSNTMPGDSRTSMDSRASRRSFTLGLGKKRSGSVAGSQASFDKSKSHRFSLIRAMGIGKEPPASPTADLSQQDLPIQDPPEVDEFGRYAEPPMSGGNLAPSYPDGVYDEPQESPRLRPAPQSGHSQQRPQQERYTYSAKPSPIPPYLQQGAVLNSGSESSIEQQPQRRPPNSAPYQTGYDSDQYDPRRYEPQHRVLHKNKRFTDAYDEHEYGRPHDHAGSSGAAKRVMDFFRRRGRARGGEP